jgi:predicted GH43/DUF377 family glycosyl hydrolase
LLGILVCSGCGRYADFTLPLLPGGDPHTTFAFDAQPAPVLSPGEGWESRDVLNPSVIRSPNPQPPTPAFLNLYSAYDGHSWHTGLASSDDGVRWQKHGKMLSPDPQTWEGSYIAANGAALFHAKQIWYWYVAGPEERPSLGLARSPDVHTWRKEPGPVLEPGPYGSWDERGVADPYVIRIDPYFYLYYLGQDRARRQRLGVARSSDGIRWERFRGNPILEPGDIGAFDEAGLGEPAVWNSQGFYWMLYTGLDPEMGRRLGLARSMDGVHWEKLPVVFAGSDPWDSKVVCDPTVLMEGDTIRVWFGGGDVASRDANLHGQIGFAILRPVSHGVSLTRP